MATSCRRTTFATAKTGASAEVFFCQVVMLFQAKSENPHEKTLHFTAVPTLQLLQKIQYFGHEITAFIQNSSLSAQYCIM